MQFESVLHYVKQQKCKNKVLLSYFGELLKTNCGICSYCVSKKKKSKLDTLLAEKIIKLIQVEPLNSRALQMMTKCSKDDLIVTLKELLEEKTILINPNNTYSIIK